MTPRYILPRAREAVAEDFVAGALLLEDQRQGNVHRLNVAATMVWRLCDGTRDPEGIAMEVADLAGLPHEEVRAKVEDTIGRFRSLGLLEA